MKVNRFLVFYACVLLIAVGESVSFADESQSAVQQALSQIDPEIQSGQYEVQRVDLDADGVLDAVVLMNGKSGYCGSGGCSLFVLRSVQGKLIKVGDIGVVSRPISVRSTSHHGMKDLLVSVRGGGAQPGVAVLEFDGKSYPQSPTAFSDQVIFPEKPEGSLKKESHLMQLNPEALAEWDTLSDRRKKLVEVALKLGRETPLNHYLFGSADPKKGGFDCSGAMFYILKQSGLTPPRSSAEQFDWIQKSGGMVKGSDEVKSLKDRFFSKLKPGDLLFWSHTYHATDGRTNGITHVQMYLGHEKKDGHPVMIGSSDGRSYRGHHQNGYGVYDFKLPHRGSTQKFVGYGPPPGIGDGSVPDAGESKKSQRDSKTQK